MATPSKEKKLHKVGTVSGFQGDDLFSSKASTKTKYKHQQSQQPQQVLLKPRVSFTAQIEKSQHIREHTQKLFLEKFDGKLDENDKIIPTELPSTTYHGARRNNVTQFAAVLESLQHGQLTEEDSRVPKATDKAFSIFPVGDKRMFPPRRPHTGCWKLGLRQYEDHATAKRVEIHTAAQENEADDTSVLSGGSANANVGLGVVAKVMSSSAKLTRTIKRQTSEDSFKMRPSSSAAQMNTFLHAQYASTDLPRLTKDQTKNYFGTTGTENFFATYRELKGRGEVLLDGFTDLEKLILKPPHKNVMLCAMQELQDLGVLTPREMDADSSVHMPDDDNSTLGSYGDATGFNSYAASPKQSKMSRANTVGANLSLLEEGGSSMEMSTPRKKSVAETMAAVVAAFSASAEHSTISRDEARQRSASSAGASLTSIYDHKMPPAQTAEEIAAEKARIERVSRERHHEVTKQGGLLELGKRVGRSSKGNTELFALIKSAKMESLPPINKPKFGSAVDVTESKSQKNSRPTSAVPKHASVKSALSYTPSRLSSARTMKSVNTLGTVHSDHTELGEIVRTASDDDMIGFSSVSSEKDDAEHENDNNEEFHGGQIFHSKPFSGKHHPSEVSGLVPEHHLTLDMEVVRSRLDDPSPDDPAMVSSYSVASPRAIFLAGCLQHAIPPVTVALIRKKISSTINLAHMGLGTKIAKVLAPCISAVPYLQLLNLSDNNLDDEGLSVLIRAISRHQSIEILDISQNIIGSDAAGALAEFLGDPECQLQCLRMSNANIDDGECANFVEVLMNNSHLKELDMSNNLLGKDENLNAVQPDFVTGGESLSELLKNPHCPLRTLNLHWNMIRLEGAEVLCDSLRTNRVLTNLDLSYNALGSSAAGVLGAALIDNNVLVELNVANNAIDEFGCFTLMAGLRENKSLRNIVLDGNPLGVQGGRILIKVATALGNRLTVSAKNCDFNIHNSNFKFNINEPYGEFLLDLSVPYERAMVLEILNICEIDSSIEFSKFEYCEAGNGSGGVFTPLKLVRFDQPITDLSRAEIRELRDLASMQAVSAGHTWDDVFHTAQKYCTLDPEVLVKSDLEKLLRELKVLDMNNVVSEVLFTLDPMQFGWVDLRELVGYMIKRSQSAQARIYDMSHETKIALSTSPTVRYVPPLTGKIRVRTIEGFSCSDDQQSSFKPISNSQCRQVLKCAENSSNPLSLILFAIEGSRMRIEEAKLMYKQVLSKTEDSIMAIAVILQHMRNTDDALRVLKHFIGTDILRWRRLKQRLGTALLPLIGIYSGFYHLDLTFPTDRVCLRKLIERSVKNCDARRKSNLSDTSQNGNWTCFRNELHYDRPEARINPKFFYPMPERAKLEFDFININRPDSQVNRAVSEDTIIDLLLMTRLLDEDRVDWAVARLAELGAYVRKSTLSNGRPTWKCEVSRAVVVNDTMYSMYNSLTARKKSYMKSQKREVATKQKEQSVKKSKTIVESTKHGRSSMVERERQREEKEKLQKAALTTNKSVEIESFRSFNLKGKSHHMKDFWSKRLFEVMYESNGTEELKSAAILEFLEIMMSTWWVYCRHLALILELFHIGAVAKSSFGSYRVDMVVMWFDHILDLHNIELVMMVLNAEEQAALYARIGILNLFNPCKPEGGWQLDLMRWEERQVAKMLIHLSVQEPGDNWSEPAFVFDHGFLPIPGWGLSVVWLAHDGLPNKGILTLEFYSGNGANMQGCMIDRRLRSILCSIVLVGQRDVLQEVKINRQENFAAQTERAEAVAVEAARAMSVAEAVMAASAKHKTNSNYSTSAKSSPKLTKGSSKRVISTVSEEVDIAEDNTEGFEGEDTFGASSSKAALMAFTRPHAVSSMAALAVQAPKMMNLYYDEKQQKVVFPYTFRDANAHLKTVNIEWSYTDGDNSKTDPWRM